MESIQIGCQNDIIFFISQTYNLKEALFINAALSAFHCRFFHFW
jgi:hypothetical protein